MGTNAFIYASEKPNCSISHSNNRGDPLWLGAILSKEKVLAMPKSSAQVTEAKGTFLHQLSKEANKQTKTKKKAVLCID